jgi:uncharacterized protein (DUF362 family)/ferredoxin
MSIVSLAVCNDYACDRVLSAMREVLAPLGGMGSFVKPGQRVALKPNILMGASPESCITTHPAVMGAAAQLVREAGAHPFIVDSPGAGIPNSIPSVRQTYKKCGFADLGIPLNENLEYVFSSTPQARITKRMEILKALLDADVIINMPKVKTHGFMVLTCAVKNMFGAIPGLLKVGYHSKLSTPERFGGMLLDILEVVRPTLNIIDGVQGMEGDGPAGGQIKSLGVLAAAPDAIIADFVICHLIGFDAGMIPYMAMAQKEGLCPRDISEVQVLSTGPIEKLMLPFEPPSTLGAKAGLVKHQFLRRLVNPVLNYALTLRPEVDKKKCVGCGACVSACPESIIKLIRGGRIGQVAHIGRRGCIRCFCCHEMCPHKAIRLRKSFLYGLINRHQV